MDNDKGIVGMSPLKTPRRQIKYRERWYVDVDPTKSGEFRLKQTRSNITVALFAIADEAYWVCAKLNHGRDLCEAVRNAMNVDDWLQREPQALVVDLQNALIAYTRDND
jgi:hypothetical protein